MMMAGTGTRVTGAIEHGFACSPADALTLAAARFVVAMRVIEDASRPDLANVDDVGSLDFFATHPLIAVEPGSDVEAELRRHGFRETPDYLQPSTIHAAHLDLARPALASLLARGCIEPRIDKALTWIVTPRGKTIAGQLTGEYFEGHAFATSTIIALVPKQGTRWKERRDSWLDNTTRFTTGYPGGT